MFDYNKKDRLAIISMNKLPVNGYDIQFFNQFENLLKSVETDSDVAVVLLKSSIPKFFCAGADIKVFQSNTIAQNKAMVVMANKVANFISNSSKIYVAFLNGHTLGGGLELALACDIRLASEKQFLIGLPEVKLGLMPGNGGVPRLVKAVGHANAFEMVVSGNPISSKDAFKMGLIHKIYTEETSEEKVNEYVVNLSKGSKSAMTAIKETFNEGFGMHLNEFLQLETKKVNTLYGTHDEKEGFLAFVEKRTPKFK